MGCSEKIVWLRRNVVEKCALGEEVYTSRVTGFIRET